MSQGFLQIRRHSKIDYDYDGRHVPVVVATNLIFVIFIVLAIISVYFNQRKYHGIINKITKGAFDLQK